MNLINNNNIRLFDWMCFYDRYVDISGYHLFGVCWYVLLIISCINTVTKVVLVSVCAARTTCLTSSGGICERFRPSLCWFTPHTTRVTRATSATRRPPPSGTTRRSTPTGTERGRVRASSRRSWAARRRTQTCFSLRWTARPATSSETSRHGFSRRHTAISCDQIHFTWDEHLWSSSNARLDAGTPDSKQQVNRC